jgi:uncharacterized repeat protein (TIGR03803 family)
MRKLTATIILVLMGASIHAQNLNLWGTTQNGGINSQGTIYKIENGSFNSLHSFDGWTEGSMPWGTLIQATNGMLYGLNPIGGNTSGTDSGVLYEFNPITNILSVKASFGSAIDDGDFPQGSPLQASNGKIYWYTSLGGTNGAGTIFEYDPLTDIYEKKADFELTNTGGVPMHSALEEANNGKLYGMTRLGGVNNLGVLFEYDPVTEVLVKKMDFDGANNGAEPMGGLELASNGSLYGTTRIGGLWDVGVLFEYDPVTDIYTKKLDFYPLTTGSSSAITLTNGPDDALYGIQSSIQGNAFVLHISKYDIALDTLTHIFDFTSTNTGGTPTPAIGANMFLGSNGKLYGTMQTGGDYDNGVVFEYELTSGTYTKLVDFDCNSTVSCFPTYGVIEVDTSLLSLNEDIQSAIQIFPNPTNDVINIISTEDLKFSVQLINVYGKIIDEFDVFSSETNLDLSTYKSGNYILKINSEKDCFIQKITKI